MATILTRNGKRGVSHVIHFYGNDRKSRFNLCLGQKYKMRQVEEIKLLIETLLGAAATKRRLYPEEEDAVKRLPKDLKRRIAQKGLLRGFEFLSVGEIWDRFIEAAHKNPKMKNSTVVSYESTQKRFMGYFEPETEPDDIERSDGDQWRDWLEDSFGLSEATAASTIVRTRTVFSWAQKNGYCQTNIFLDTRKGSTENKENEFYIPMDWFDKLLDECPSQQWRVYIALMRIGGLRMGEAHILLWENILWNDERIRVASPKTERFSGKEERIIPMFSRLKTELYQLAEMPSTIQTGPILTDVFNGRSQKAIDEQLKRMIERAGLTVWPRLNHNLRGSRSNELFSAFPDHVAEYWMGHSQKVAKKHYLHVLTDQYNLAQTFDKEKDQDEKTQQKPQKRPEMPPTESSTSETDHKNDDHK